ncbi:iron reductase [Geobacillus sp. PA-3]|jgi:ferric iron reductase protein FhuF|uniref:IucA/IucC family C-terminal-domain containing protein n=1 Tax=Geobacillus sp. PA-3 TaxID=1699078 RepID=UPI0006E59CF5|nr:IucA/IucC family C-terminal-domain containing protein [Geobacillus sp. PA-3]KQB93664.1 iron reductase [Geobacillus sp. PA-3]
MRLSEAEIKALETYRFSGGTANVSSSMLFAQLLHDDEQLAKYVAHVRNEMGAANDAVAASMLVKRLSFLAPMALYAMSIWNKRLVLDPRRIWLDTDDEGEMWMPRFRLEPPEAEVCDIERSRWREQAVHDVFASLFAPLIAQLRHLTRISPLVLWENVAIYVYWVYERWLEDESLAPVADRLRDDFRFLIYEADGRLFGQKDNPLRRFFKGASGMQRTTCCLYVQTKGGTCCQTCPLKARQRQTG